MDAPTTTAAKLKGCKMAAILNAGMSYLVVGFTGGVESTIDN